VQLDTGDTPADLAVRGWDLIDTDEEIPAAAFDEAIRLLTTAIATGHGDPDEPVWQFWLASAHLGRAGEDGYADLDRAGAVLNQVVSGPEHPWLEPDGPAAELALLYVRRHVAEPQRYEIDGVRADLDALPIRVPDSPGAAIVAFYQRYTRLQVAASQDSTDVGRAAADLQAVLPHLPDDMPLLIDALLLHAEVCGARQMFGDGLTSVLRARHLPDGIGGLPELEVVEAELRYRRWLADDPEADLDAERDAAITCIDRAATTSELPLFVCLMHGELLTHRGDERDDADDLALGGDQLRRCLDGDLPDPGDVWFQIALAHHRRWRITTDPDQRDLAIDAFGTALHHGVDDMQLVVAHGLRAAAVTDTAVSGRAADPPLTRELLRTGHDALDRAGTGADPTDRALLAGMLLMLQFTLGVDDSAAVEPLRVARYLQIARSHPEPPPGWLDELDLVETVLGLLDQIVNGRRGGSGLGPVGPLLARAEERPELRILIAIGLLGEGAATGDRGLLRAARDLLVDDESADARMFVAMLDIGLLHSRGAEPAELRDALDELIRRVEDVAADPQDIWTREVLLPMFSSLGTVGRPVGAAGIDPVPGRSAAPGSLASIVGGIASVMASVSRLTSPQADSRERQRAVVDARRRVDELPTGSVQRMVADGMLAAVLNTVAGDPAGVDEAVRRADDSLAALGGAQHPIWAQTAMAAADARRRRLRLGDRARSRELGLAALRGRAWLVLLQAGTGDGMAVARVAAAEARRVALWCLEDRQFGPGALDDLVVALEAGRGLVLHAAVTSRSVSDRLAVLGQHRLAAEWDHADGADEIDLGPVAPGVAPHGDLRRRVLLALSAGGEGALLDAPTVATVRDILRRHGTDVLVHLLAGTGTRPGHAILVPARGDVQVLELPDLREGPGTELNRYTTAFTRWHGPDPETADERRAAFERWRSALGSLTGWAWSVAGGPVLEAATRFAADPALPRLAFAPSGPLALVPWHAARPDVGDRSVLASRAVVSTVPSARLIEQALDRPSTGSGAALIVGNPTGDLRSAGAEAHAVHDAFQPAATYLGRAPVGGQRGTAGEGSAAEVLAWLDAHPEGAALLHLACHAVADVADPLRSRLRLADGPLAIGDLLAHRPTGRIPLDRVVLSACATNVSGDDHDEAFSLATTFLAAGARTVFGSMWTVPDAYTSRLVFMVHHYLHVDGCRPADALHRAQRWALDPDRIAPATMPAQLVAARSALAPDDPVAWAGFVHLGV
jgi:hypothetical protein